MKRFSIRVKMWTVFVNLFLLAFSLAVAGLFAISQYKTVVRYIAWRANVLPVAAKLSEHVGELRTVVGELRGVRRSRFGMPTIEIMEERPLLESRFQKSFFEAKRSFNDYRQTLEDRLAEERQESRFEEELQILHEIRQSLTMLDSVGNWKDWAQVDGTILLVETELTKLQRLAAKLPANLQADLHGYSQTMRRQFRWLNAIMLTCMIVSAVLMLLLVQLSYIWIFKPLGILIAGSRKIAEGKFQYRIELMSRDEMADLAEAMNHMTERFESIRQDLDLKGQQRSRELIQSERLASVGFLAAGVAHEINNPLAAISACAESLQRRMAPVLEQSTLATSEAELVRRYLKMIEDEAFRCKDITEKLLSFARSEKKEREKTDWAQLIRDIVEMTQQHDSFKRTAIELDLPESLIITANPQEMKQVILNLLTNALTNTDQGGRVTIRLHREPGRHLATGGEKESERAVLTISDNGCGMDTSTLKNIFEPFFTLRRHGQGTGLGLSITHRIIEDHHGRIEAHSDGHGQGSTFKVDLPLQ